MKRLLLITTRFPLPLTSGFANKNMNLIKALSSVYLIDLVVVDSTVPSDNDVSKVSKYVSSVSFFRPTKTDICIGIMISILKFRPIHFGLFYSSAARAKIDALVIGSDVVVGSVARVWPYLYKMNVPVFMDLADSLTLTYRNNFKVSNIIKPNLTVMVKIA